MKMLDTNNLNSNRTRWFVIIAIVFVTFNILAFVIPFRRSVVFWVTYFFSNTAILSQILIYSIAFDKANNVRRVFLGLPLMKIGYSYVVAQIFIGVSMMIYATFVPTMPAWIAVVISVLLMAFTAISIIFSHAARERIQHLETTQVVNTLFINMLRADLESLIPRVEDSDLKQNISRLSDAVRYSDPVSRAELAEIESTISHKFTLLKQDAMSGSVDKANAVVNELSHLINERNQKSRILKRVPIPRQ